MGEKLDPWRVIQADITEIAAPRWLSPGTRLQRLRDLRFQLTETLDALDEQITNLKSELVEEYRADPHRATRGWAYIELWKEMETVARVARMNEEDKLAWAAAIKKQMAALTAIAYDPTPEASNLYEQAPTPRFRREELVIWPAGD